MKRIPLLLAMFALVTSCDLFNSEKAPTEIQLDSKSVSIVESTNLFGFQLFETVLSTENENKNIMVSPLSVSQALSMALNGAGGNTFDQMQQVLDFEGLPLTDINESNLSLVNSLINHDQKVTMQIANSVWYRNDFTPKSDFINNNKTFYSAEVNSYNPADPEGAKKLMNNWVEDKTKGKIDEIIDAVEPSHVLFLINAVYFKAEWKTQFKKSDTRDLPFTLDNSVEKELETMTGEVDLSYLNEENYSAIKLPYGSGKFNMVIFLPEEGFTTNDIATEIQNTDFEALDKSALTKREIWLPKFEFNYKNELNDELISMGMNDAFNPGAANFENISDVGLCISKVNHKTYIKTDEEGSEAAAATSIEFRYTSVGPSETIKINRSFLFAIVEDNTHSILFIGKVFDPSVTE